MSHTIVIFGATGDLAREKLFPALMRLFHDGDMPKDTQIIGFSRRAWTDEAFHAHIHSYLKVRSLDTAEADGFVKKVHYHQGTFDDLASYDALAKRIYGSLLLYLSVAPQQYTTIIETLKKSTLKNAFKDPQSRILVEKPFGLDATSAKTLDTVLREICKEEQIARVDHYLAKPAVLTIQKQAPIHIRILEKKDIGTRGASYDGVGALIDVGQNHLLEVLATVLQKYTTGRVAVLQSLSVEDAEHGQYEGYRFHEGVDPHSQKETYFKLLLKTSVPALRDTKIVLEGGKAMAESVASVNDINLNARSANIREAYEEVFYRAMQGDNTLFPTLDEILEAWRIIAEAQQILEKKPLHIYPKNSTISL